MIAVFFCIMSIGNPMLACLNVSPPDSESVLVVAKTWEEVERILGEEPTTIIISGSLTNPSIKKYYANSRAMLRYDLRLELIIGYAKKK